MPKGFDLDSFLGSPIGNMAYQGGMNILGDIFNARARRKQLRDSQKDAEKELLNAYKYLSEDLATSYGTSGLENTYGTGLYANYKKGLDQTREQYARARKSSKSFLGSIFFGR